MKKILISLAFITFYYILTAQDLNYAKAVILKLCSPEMEGRGYVNAGDKKAALYVASEFKKFNLIPFDSAIQKIGNDKGLKKPKYTQEFYIRINTFPKKLRVGFSKMKALIPGEDYLIGPNSCTFKSQTLELFYLQKKHIKNEKEFDYFINEDYTGLCVIIDKEAFEKQKENEFYKQALKNEMSADAILILESNKLTWNVGRVADNYPTIILQKDKLPKDVNRIEIEIETRQVFKYETQNVLGYVEGKLHPEKYIVFGAHYDHLGKMGNDTYFPGANDNASGVAMLLDLAKYFIDPFNQPDYSIAFIAFGAEETGLNGSRFYNEHPMFPLKKIEFMINLDLMGTGKDGMMVVNATENMKEYDKLVKINEQKQYIKEVKKRGPAAISDHHFFHENGVKSVFIYLMDELYKYYHDINDTAENCNLAGYEGTFKLLLDFVKELQK